MASLMRSRCGAGQQSASTCFCHRALSRLLRQARRVLDHLRDLNVLNRHSGQVRHGDLVVAGSADPRVLDDIAQFENEALFDVVSLNRMEALTVIDTL